MSHIPTSDQALDAWLNQDSNRELNADYSDWKLDPVRDALAALNVASPIRPITVAGTKGKGSTVAFLERIIAAHDRQVVAFTSPHVLNLRERWRLKGDPMPLDLIARHCPRVDQAIASASGHATYFERSFLLACCIVEDLEADFICEVGLGGRLDCANVLDAKVVCLSSLGLDHTNVLGPTIAHIAREKLGVCRSDAPLYIAEQSPEAATAIANNLPAVASHHQVSPLNIDFVARHPLGLAGHHQHANAATALVAARAFLGDTTYNEAIAHQALGQAKLMGRCQVLNHSANGRRYIIDGAHTQESIAATITFAQSHFAPATASEPAQWAIILGVANDKDIAAIRAALPNVPILRCGYEWGRCAQSEDPAWPNECQSWPWADDISQALDHPFLRNYQNILVTGSFYLAGEALEALLPEA